MQKNRGGRTSPIKSRSASASSASASSATSSSGSSSSGSSSSSSSSGSGSDSSSDTEASRASSQSRASRSSQKSSNQATPVKKGPNKTIANSPATNNKKTPAKTKNTQGNSTITTSKNRISGTVTNTKTISPLSKGLTAKNTKRKTIATSSESEADPEPPPQPIKKVATKPAPPPPVTKAPAKGRKKATPTTTTTNTPATKNTGKNTTTPTKGNTTKKGKAATSNNENINTSKSGGGQTRKSNQTKSIFSPENSSEDSDSSISKPVVNTVSKSKLTTNNKQSNVSTLKGSKKGNATATTAAGNKKKGAVGNATKKKQTTTLPTPTTPLSAKSASSTSSAASGTNSSASSTSSSSDSASSSDEAEEEEEPAAAASSSTTTIKKPSKEQQNNDQELSDNKNDSAPSSPNNVRKTRPVTRRQQRRTVKSKTIPTTTAFNQNILTQSVSQVSSAYDSAASDFSDEPKSLARVPAKSQHKPRIKPSEEDEEALERERKCPFPCCDSQGHLSGRYSTHYMLTTCPKYHGFTLEECKENAEEREKRETERKKYYVPNQPHHKKPRQLSQDSKNWIAKTKELKQQTTSDGLCSEYDLSLWNDSLALAAGKIEQEQGEALSFRSIAMGRWEMSCWCASPYPEPLCHCRRLFICEFCLKPVQSGTVLRRHCAKCVWRHPPGDEIYRKDRLSVWEVDGKNQKTYCQNLCLLAKCFLDHKTLYLDVDPFLFYVMTLADSTGCHIVGYFSKEKNQSFLNYNVSCILTLPPYMRQGFGRLLIDFSYLLTRVEGKVGSPEKPLSDLGLISYRSYWKDAVLRRMCACASREMNVKDLSIELGVTSADLISTLQFLGMLKYWKGKHLVLKKQDVLEEYLERVRRRGEQRQIDSSCLRWRPASTTD